VKRFASKVDRVLFGEKLLNQIDEHLLFMLDQKRVQRIHLVNVESGLLGLLRHNLFDTRAHLEQILSAHATRY